MELEHFFSCPYCGDAISMLLDLSESPQEYTEDCQTCCRPILVSYTSLDGALQTFEAQPA